YKLRGRFALVQTVRRGQKPGKEWLLIKKQDESADPEAELAETSIYSGLTVEEMSSRSKRSEAILAELAELGAPKRRFEIQDVDLMLCQPRKRPFSADGWIYELKYDGYRLLASAESGVPKLRYRRGMDATRLYPELTRALAGLPYPSFIVDGEAVVFDSDGRTDFGRLQQRAMLSKRLDVERSAIEHPVNMVVFDLLAFGDFDLRPLPLLERKRLLRELLPETGPLRYCDHIEREGEAFCAKVAELHLEGIVCKKADSRYVGRRSDDWRKVRLEFIDEFAVVGYSLPRKSSRPEFRALQLAVRDGDDWSYAGAVGSGFSEDELVEIRALLDQAEPARYDFEVDANSGESVWVEPSVVVQVRYLEWREGKSVRQPVFLALVPDMDPHQTRRRRVGADEPSPEDVPVLSEQVDRADRAIHLSNQGKIFWPEHGYTKGELVGYYRTIYPWLEPYLRDRPVVMTRYPDGIHGKSFFQKDAPSWVPDWIQTEEMWSEHGQRHIRYFVCNNEESVAYLANLGTIPLHVWSSRVGSLAAPDWCILDLDPKEAPFESVVKVARAIKKLCDQIQLPTYVKTSGSTGLHVLIPLGGQCTYQQSKTLGHLIARIIEDENRDIATTTRNPAKREGKVYLDYVQNGHGRLLVAPFSVRPLVGAPVSMPLRWSEVKAGLDIHRFTIANAVARMKKLKDEPLLAVLEDSPDLLAALEALAKRLS
ncbi:MAG: DNA ligase D, partial [Deltaproteobacteria bacterium]|nr:DNA ligase D [Deltaproteobacteria bacterium]